MLKKLTIYDNRERFCEALRSTPLKQCSGCFSQDGYAADLAVPAKLAHNGGTIGTACALGVGIAAGVFGPSTIYDNRKEHSVWARIGIRPTEIDMRNDEGMSFCEIADWIEAQP